MTRLLGAVQTLVGLGQVGMTLPDVHRAVQLDTELYVRAALILISGITHWVQRKYNPDGTRAEVAWQPKA